MGRPKKKSKIRYCKCGTKLLTKADRCNPCQRAYYKEWMANNPVSAERRKAKLKETSQLWAEENS